MGSDPRYEGLNKYLTDGERIVVATHRHWFAVAEPLATATFSMLLIGATLIAGAPGSLVQALLVGWLVVLGRAILRLCEWNLEWFVATDQRLLLIYGFIIRKVDMLPMSKVTDMTFRRSLLGRLFGYGTFVLESAGQEQALSDLHFIPDPNDTYLRIVGTIFKTAPDEEDGYLDEPEDPDGDESGVFDAERHEPYDAWDEEDDPTARPSLRGEIARLGRRDSPREDPDRLTFTLGVGTPPDAPERRRAKKRHLLREPDYAETLYTSRPVGTDPWDEQDRGPHETRLPWWRR